MAIEKLNLDPKLKGQTGAKPTIEYLRLTGNKIDELIEEAIIVESGTNENGTYIRYSNGIQICFDKVSKEKFKKGSSSYEMVQNLKIYRSNSAKLAYPKNFINADINVYCGLNASNFWIYNSIIAGPGTANVYIQISGLEDFLETSLGYTSIVYVYYLAIGFWK